MITFRRPAYDTLVQTALAAPDTEICGILGGAFDDSESIVASLYETSNVASTPRSRYRIAPEEQLAVMQTIEAANEEVVGFYHSHPAGPPGPSFTDTEQATWAGRSYVIVALDGEPFVGSWRWREQNGFQPECVTIVDNT